MTYEEACQACDEFTDKWPNSAFGPAHIVLDDFNFQPGHIQFCLDRLDAALAGDPEYRDHERDELLATKDFLTGLQVDD